MQVRPVHHVVHVRRSVTFMTSVKTSNRILRLFSPSGSQTISSFSTLNVMAIFWRGPPNAGVVSTAGGVGTNRDSGPVAAYWSMTAAVRNQQSMVVVVVVYLYSASRSASNALIVP